MATYSQNGLITVKDTEGDTHQVYPITKDENVNLSSAIISAYGLAAGSKADEVLAKLAASIVKDGSALKDTLGNPITIPSAQLDSQMKIATGSYTGTGTYGVSNKNSITFTFAPKVVVITLNSTSFSNGEEALPLILINPSSYTWASPDTYQTITWSGNTVYWHNLASAQFQHNTSGLTFRYVAIG